MPAGPRTKFDWDLKNVSTGEFVMLGEQIKLQVELEQEAGRRRLELGRPAAFFEEVDAGRRLEERAQARFEREVEAGRCTAAKQSTSTSSA